MVELKKVTKGNKDYFYLVHSFRDGKKVSKKQVYLGSLIPKDLEKAKKDFMQDFYKEKFLGSIDSIKKNFSKELSALPKSAKAKALENFAIKFTYNTQRIEGSTLTLRETADLLENGIAPSSKPMRDAKEAEAHKKLFYEMLSYDKDLTLQIVLKWHATLMSETHSDIAGKVRGHDVAIAQSKFKPPKYQIVNLLLKEFFSWYTKEKKFLHPVELAALVHLKFVTIHPFTDGNGRISRIMMNFVLKKCGFPMLDIDYVKRTSYYNALERSQTKNDESIFVQWFFRRYLSEYKKYVNS